MRNAKLFNKRVKRRRGENEIPTALTAIRNHCLECVGYQPSEVASCTAPKCWMYPLRFGKYPKH